MSQVIRFFGQYIRQFLYIVVSIPIGLVLFMGVNFALGGWDGPGFLPLAVALFLGMLTVMEWVARTEIKRTNAMLGTDFQIEDNWFEHSFFSWEGVRERVTSLRSWLAVLYVFVAFGFAIISVLMVGLSVVALAMLAIAASALPIADLSGSFRIANEVRGFFSVDSSGSAITINVTDQGQNVEVIPGTYDFASWPTVIFALLLLVFAAFVISRLARGLAANVEGLLSGKALPEVRAALARLSQKVKISDAEVRQAMQSEPIRSELDELSPREREILALMAQGKSNAAISRALYITEGSVEKHISKILSKLNLEVDSENHRRVLAVLTYLGLQNPKE